ncbi:MAG: leucyl/phenylalanyl-tRNA--protein transferase [Pseudomonadota bacterium]
MQLVLTSELLLEAYRQGLFPMAYSAESPYVHWICPEERGQLPIEGLHISKSLLKNVKINLKRNEPFQIKINTAFEAVMRKCAAARDDRPETWINEPIIEAYCGLRARGHAHSVECWADDTLVGGLYGVSIGAAFFGESMFSRQSNASKIALVHLCARLWKAGYKVLDTQFVNDHLKQFGVYELSHKQYLERLQEVLPIETDFMLESIDEAALVPEYLEARKPKNDIGFIDR